MLWHSVWKTSLWILCFAYMPVAVDLQLGMYLSALVPWLNQGGSSIAQGLCWIIIHALVLQQVLEGGRYEDHGGLVL